VSAQTCTLKAENAQVSIANPRWSWGGPMPIQAALFVIIWRESSLSMNSNEMRKRKRQLATVSGKSIKFCN
jgi:hypothetical protein